MSASVRSQTFIPNLSGFGASVRFAVPNDFIAVIVFDELIEEILRGSVVSEISSWAMAKIVLRLFQRR